MGEKAQRWTSLHVVFDKYYWGDQIYEYDIGRVCGTCGGRDTLICFGERNMKARDQCSDLGVDDKTTLK
jgi:hypothetical protein